MYDLTMPLNAFKTHPDVLINEILKTGKTAYVICSGYKLIISVQMAEAANESQYINVKSESL